MVSSLFFSSPDDCVSNMTVCISFYTSTSQRERERERERPREVKKNEINFFKALY